MTSLNKGNLPINIMALTGVIIMFYLVLKTRLFTKFNFKNKNENEKNS